MKKILVSATNYSRYCTKAKRLLVDNGCEVIENPHGRPFTFDELKPIVGEIDGVVAGVDNWNENVFRIAPRLKIIARFGVGVDNIDIARAAEHGIAVTNCPGINANAVAEQAVGLLLSIVRQIPRLNASTSKGKWERLMFPELRGKRLAMLGFGAVACKFAQKMAGFDMEMVACDKYPNYEKAKELNVKMVTFEEAISTADFISIHLPALPELYHIINSQTISMMKDGVYIVNTARGVLADENAVYDALKSGKIAGYASDVFEVEPARQDNKLFELDNYVCTPHTAAETYENYEQCGLVTAKAILDVFAGKTPENLLNKIQ